MIVILQFIRNYWIIIVMVCIFSAGWHLRSLAYLAQENHDIIKLNKRIQNADQSYNEAVTKDSRLTEKLNQKLKDTYAETGNRCIIPADGLRLIQQANH